MSDNPSLKRPATTCALPGCENPVVQPATDGRPRLYCRAEHRLEARRLRRQSQRAGGGTDARPVRDMRPVPDVRPAVPPTGTAGPRQAAVPEWTPARTWPAVTAWPATMGWPAATTWLRGHLRTAVLMFAVGVLATNSALPSAPEPTNHAAAAPAAAAPPAAAAAGGGTGLYASLWQGYAAAGPELAVTRQQAEAVRSTARALAASAAGSPSPAVSEALAQLRRREAALEHNRAVLERQIEAWTSYVRLWTAYTAGNRELAAVDDAVRALEAVPDRDSLPASAATLAGLRERRAALQQSLRDQATALSRLLFSDVGAVLDLPPMPTMPELTDAAGAPQRT